MKTIYWSSTIIVSGFLFISAYSYIYSQATITGIRALGFPDFFRIELAILKGLAAIILLWPFPMPIVIKEWAYAGVGLFLLTAFVAHIAHKDSILIQFTLIALMAGLIISNIYMYK